MVQFTIPKGSFVVTSIKRTSFRVLAQAISQNTPTIVVQLAWLQRLSTLTPLELDMSYGPSSLPGGQPNEWYMGLVDIDNLPSIEGLADRAIWSAAALWVVTSSVGINQALKRETADFFNPASFTVTEVADFTTRMLIALMNHSGAGSPPTVNAIGVLTYQEDVVQRVFPSDDWTFTTRTKSNEMKWEYSQIEEGFDSNDGNE